ncbi:MAG: thiamine ABC transporter substrate-binding protein [Candidatus Cloacimonetes bacterium]|nr:thiamine ABC transporter substrate-binding protein [Candidatus Cloacimonadota bacterium]
MKNWILICFILMIFIFSCSLKKEATPTFESEELNVYASEVLLNEDFLEESMSLFEGIFNCKVNLQIFVTAQAMVEQTIAEKDSTKADVLFGIDNTLLYLALKESLFVEYEPKNLKYVNEDVIFDKTNHIIPVSYSDLGIIYNSRNISNAPVTFGEMQDGKFKNQIIIMDPRKSSLGRAMLFWSIAAFGEHGYGHFWRSIKENIFAITESFDEAYNMFLAAEAPLMLGYVTTPIFHIKKDNTDKYKSTIPQEGGFKLIKGVGILRSTKNQKLAEQFVEFLLSEEFQELIPLEMWMFPVNKNIKLSTEYKLLPEPKRDFTKELSLRTIQWRYKSWIKKWEMIMLK